MPRPFLLPVLPWSAPGPANPYLDCVAVSTAVSNFPPQHFCLATGGKSKASCTRWSGTPSACGYGNDRCGALSPVLCHYSPEIRESPIFYPPSVFSPLPQGKKKRKKIPRTKGWKPRHPLLLQLWPRRVSLGAKEARKRSLFLKQAMFILVA